MQVLRNSLIYFSAFLITIRLGFLVYPIYFILPFLQPSYKFNKLLLMYLLLAILFFAGKSFYETDVSVSIESFKYYFGFIVFMIFFYSSSNKINNNLVLLLVLLFVSIFIEYFIINYNLLPSQYWFNVANADGALLHLQTEGQMRPYGIGKNATMTATLIVTFYVHLMTEINHKYLTDFKIKILLTLLFITSVLVVGSGLGYFLSIVAMYFVLANTKTKRIIFLFLLLLLFAVTFYIIETNLDGFSRFSLSYVEYLIEFKKEQLFVTLLPENYGVIEILFGALNQRGFSNDVGWIPFFYAVGLFGSIMYGLILLFNTNEYNRKSLFILLLGAWHYAAIFSIPGQILFAYLLSRRGNNI